MSSEVRLIENWREKWEERTTHGRPIVAVVEINGRIEVWALLSSNHGMATYAENFLIPKPQPKKLRHWRREEVPVGSVVRNRDGDLRLITGATEVAVYVNGWHLSFSDILKGHVRHDLNPDGTWKPVEQCRPCGVEE